MWHPTSLCHLKGLASLLSRQEYYSIHRHSNCSSADPWQAINAHWPQLWVWGWAAAGDESIVPHKGNRADPMRMFIRRKPHSTGIKFFVLGDSVHPFVTDIFLYAGKRVRIFQGRDNVAGPRNAREMVHRWVDLLPPQTALVCDGYFGTHAVAHQLARRQHPFLFLTRRDQEPGTRLRLPVIPFCLGKWPRPMSAKGVKVYMFSKTPRWAANPLGWCPLCPIVNTMG